MGIMDRERQIAAKCREALQADGIKDKFSFLILVAMAWDKTVTFEWACDAMAAGYRERFKDIQDVRTHIAYTLLKAGIEPPTVEEYFTRKVKEVLAHESKTDL